jgi:hypothetical protein
MLVLETWQREIQDRAEVTGTKMSACRLASVALALAGWFVSGQAQTGCKSNDPAGYFEGTSTSQHEGKLDVSLNLRCDSGRHAGELVTPVGTYTVKDGHFEANQLHLNLDSGGDSVTIEAVFDAGVLRCKFVAAADTGPVALHRTGDARNTAAAAETLNLSKQQWHQDLDFLVR